MLTIGMRVSMRTVLAMSELLPVSDSCSRVAGMNGLLPGIAPCLGAVLLGILYRLQARSSDWLEHYLDMVGVVGSSPIAPTIL